MVGTEHIDDKKVDVAVTIQIGKVNTHGKGGGVAQRQSRQGTKLAGSVVDPDTVGRKQIVTDVKIGSAVAINVMKLHGQSPVARGLNQRPARFIQKCAFSPGDLGEMALAIV